MISKRARAIRNGELDDERPSYEELEAWMTRLPMSMLPAMLGQVVAECVFKQPFADDVALQSVVKRTILLAHEQPEEFRGK